MANAKSQPGKLRAYFLVRSPDGKPKFDNINNIDQGYWDMLTDSEKSEIQQERKNGSNSRSGNS